MAALLDLTVLRRHALPAHFMPGFYREIAGRIATTASRRAPVRSPLRSTWHIGSSDRPVCIWTVDTDDPDLVSA